MPLAVLLELLLELLELLLAEVVAAGVPVELAPLLDEVVATAVPVVAAPWPWLLLELWPVVGIFAEIPAGKITRCPGTSGKLLFMLKKSRRF